MRHGYTEEDLTIWAGQHIHPAWEYVNRYLICPGLGQEILSSMVRGSRMESLSERIRCREDVPTLCNALLSTGR